ncbi:MAG: hypothetical protein C3F15_05720 [Holophagae bacterium]|nr:MAG: hypothetical protein C3F15_05720 [Holophagae bacterium]
MRHLGLAPLVLLVALRVAGAAEPTLDVRLEPERFGVEDVARLVVKVHEPPGDLAEPDLGELVNLRVVAGPSRGSEFSFVNGVTSSAVSFSYVIRAEAEGPASVGPVSVATGGTRLVAGPLKVEVAPGSLASPRRGSRVSPFPIDPFGDLYGRRQPEQEAKVVLRQIVTPLSAVVGQPVTATVVLDTTAAVDEFGWVTAPAYPGWWTQRVEPPEQVTPEPVEIDGVRFNRFTVSRHALIPLKAGELVIPEARARVGARGRGFLDPGQVAECATAEIRVAVSERPPAPKGFAGAVGELRYTASVEPGQIAFGESAVVTVQLEGSGNLPLVEAPAVWPSCEGCEVYPPENVDRVVVDDDGIHGSRAWRVTVVPSQPGRLQLGPVELATFDPAAGRYRRQTVGPLELTVAPPPATPTAVAPPAAAEGQAPVTAQEPGAAAPVGSAVTPWWVPAGAALGLGILIGGAVMWWFGRARRRSAIPPRRSGESPAERARTLSVALERWWIDVGEQGRADGLEAEVEALRRELEAVRFAPGRADHSETIIGLEERLRRLLRGS